MADRVPADPPLTPESAPFFEAARESRFLIRRCGGCGRTHWYPRAVCPHCLSETTWEEASGKGTIYSYSVMRRADPVYTIAYVTLAEGPTLMTNLVDCDVDGLSIGQAVELAWTPSANGTPVPCFKPAG